MPPSTQDRRPGSAFEDPRYRKRFGKGLMTIGICFLINMATTPSLPWWIVPALSICLGLFFDHGDARRRQRALGDLRTRPAEQVPSSALPTRPADERQAPEAEDRHVPEVRKLRSAVEALVGRLSPAQVELLGDVLTPVETLESRVRALVRQGREVDAELALHDAERVGRELEAARDRVEALPSGPQRAEEEATLRVLEQQDESLQRVRAARSRIDARLRTAVGMLRALHLDLVELLSTDLEGSSSTIRRIGDQVREVSTGVVALANAVDEVMLDDLGPHARTVAPRRRGRTRG